MLYSVVIGKQEEINNSWVLEEDEKFNFKYITCADIQQRIRFGNHVSGDLQKVYSSANASAYKLPEETYFSNNYKNMSLVLMKQWGKKPQGNRTEILYMTLMNENYKLLSYEIPEDFMIVQTYRKKDKYQGCGIAFNPSALEASNGRVMSLIAKDYHMNKSVYILVEIKNGRVSIVKKPVELPDMVYKVKELNRKYANRNLNIKMTVPSEEMITCTYILDPNHADFADEILDKFPNARIIELTQDEIDSTSAGNNDEMVEEVLQKHIIDSRIRAITTVGIRLPFEFCKKYHILYLFDYNTENGVVTCVKSN